MSIELRQYERYNTRVGASAARPPLVPRPFADAASLSFDKSSAEAKAGLESGTALLLDLAERVAAPEPDPDALRGLTRVAESARARLPEGSRDYLDAVGPVTASVVTPLEERRRQAAMVGLAGALTQQKAVLRRLALLGAPLSTLRAVAKGQVEKLHATGLMAGDRATLERAWDEELAGNHLLGRLDKDADLPLAEQPEAGLLEPETLLHLEGLQRQRQAARRSEQLGGVLQGAVTGAAAGRAPSAEQAAALEGELPGLSQAAAREAEAWHQKQDAILGLVERNPLLGKLKDLAGGGPLYRRLLVEQQRRAGVPETDLRIWDQGESDAAVAAVLALPDEDASESERSAALLGFARQHLAGLPAELRPLALAELTRRGLAPEDAAALDAVAGDLAARRDIAALATARGWARQGRVEDPSATPGLVQVADSGEIASDADPGPLQLAQTIPFPPTRPLLPGAGTPDNDGLARAIQGLPPAQGQSALIEPWDLRETEPIAIVPPQALHADPALRAAADLLARGGMTATEADAVIGELAPLRGAGADLDLTQLAVDYAALLPAGAGDAARQRRAVAGLAQAFQEIQTAGGQMTLAELALLERSPAYAEASGRGVVWVDDARQVVGSLVPTPEARQRVIETPDGLFFAVRHAEGRWRIEDFVLQGESPKPQRAPDTTSAVAAAGMPDPDEEPRNATVYRSVNRKTGEVEYVGATRNFPLRRYYWARIRGYDVERLEELGDLTWSEARGVEQVLIEHHELGRFGGTLANRIFSIGIRNPRYAELLRVGRDLLRSINYPGIE